MHLFDRKFSLLLLLFALPLLFLPKINLISVDAEESAGLRIDDLFLFFVGIFVLLGHSFSPQKLYKVEGWILAITFLGLGSFLMNRLFVSLEWLHGDAKIFYTVRLLEYFLFFYIGGIISQFFSMRIVIITFFLWNFLLMTLQKFNLVGGVIATGYDADVSGRVQGIASFPSEMGLLLNLLFCYLIFDQSPVRWIKLFRSPFTRLILNKLYLYGLFCLFAIFVIFTGNRISIAALCISFFFRLKQDLNLRSLGSYLSMLIFVPLAAFAMGLVIMQTSGVYERSAALFSWKNVELFSIVWEKIDTAQNPMGNEEIKSENYDMSWWLRIHKWLFMMKSYLENPCCYIQGLGPGYAGAALDGGLLRILTEYGLLGLYLFWKFFGALYRVNLQTKWMVIALLINMLFFDAYLAYKSMSFLLLACGYLFDRKQCKLSVATPAIA